MKHPQDMHFNLNMDHVPGNFLLADVKVGRDQNVASIISNNSLINFSSLSSHIIASFKVFYQKKTTVYPSHFSGVTQEDYEGFGDTSIFWGCIDCRDESAAESTRLDVPDVDVEPTSDQEMEDAADHSEGAADHSEIVRPYSSEDEEEIDMGSFAIPAVHEESSLVNEEPTHVGIGEAPLFIFRLCRVGSRIEVSSFTTVGDSPTMSSSEGRRTPPCGKARATQAIGHGGYVEYPDISEELTDGGEDPHPSHLKALEDMMMELNHTMQEILLHASTRLVDDGGLYH